MSVERATRYETHHEPNGDRYERCRECGRESIHGESDILHTSECPEAQR